MITEIDYDWGQEDYRTSNPLFEDLPQYHFDRSDMCNVFDEEFMDWFWDHLEHRNEDFLITRSGDEFYIIHFPSGTIVNWYKHVGRTNTCNKNLTLDDLREFKKMLLDSFGYEEVVEMSTHFDYTYDELIESAKEHEICFGQYYDENGKVCEEGAAGLCSYCVECQRECIYY